MPDPKATAVTEALAEPTPIEPGERRPSDSHQEGMEQSRVDAGAHAQGNFRNGEGGAKTDTRIDRWLTAARIYKSRSQAQCACEGGHVSVNGVAVKSSRTVQIGDKVVARAPRGLVVVVVTGVEEKRQGASRARELYDDQSPPPVERELATGFRPRGSGRPTKADRRAIARLTDEEDD